jgi:hypothetical protein
MFLGSTARPARKADNLTAICEPIGILNISQPYRPIGILGNHYCENLKS